MAHHIAQLNIGRLRRPLDHPDSKGFVDRLGPVNALADAAPGFVWRLQTDEGDATAIRAFDDPTLLINLSVWASLEALRDFVYGGDHVAVLRRRQDWFEPLDEPHMALWWEQAGRVPTILEAKDRLDRLRRTGPTQYAFTFRDTFPPPTE